MTGSVIGYDPGGNDKHGVARATVRDGRILDVTTETCRDLEAVISFVFKCKPLLGIGIDTLTCWATGKSGLRPADRWLRRRYEIRKSSVVPPNSLYGSMSLNGMALVVEARNQCGDVFVTETHPKLLYHHLYDGEPYDYSGRRTLMDERLCARLGVRVAPGNSHEWDAAISILSPIRRWDGSWPGDLHTLPTDANERLIRPCGNTSYVWPEDAQDPNGHVEARAANAGGSTGSD